MNIQYTYMYVYIFLLLFPEVHVEGEVHELLWEVLYGENEEGDPHSHGIPPIVGPHSSVVTNLHKQKKI